jgi:hypothetical protein
MANSCPPHRGACCEVWSTASRGLATAPRSGWRLRGFVELEGANSEYGPGQCEVNLGHLDALEAADQAARFKYATRELARRHDAIATFMAKPFGDQAGNSMHLHLSL